MPPEPVLPSWAQELRVRYVSGEASLFLVHGNLRDLQRYEEDGQVEWLDMRSFLERFLTRTRDIVASYNLSQGVQFPDRGHQRRFEATIAARRALLGEPPLTTLPRAPGQAIPLLEDLLASPTHPTGVVIDFLETLVPNGDLSYMGGEEKANLVALQRWSGDPALLATNNIVILLTEHLSDVSRRVVASPQLATIQVPFPDETTRLDFLERADLEDVPLSMDAKALARVTAGLSLVQIRALLRGARQTGTPIDFASVSQRKKTIIEQECHGLVELVAPRHDFSHVGGMERVKADLMKVADAVKGGHTHRVPMGMIFVGPMGTGKTFVAEAFAAECGLTCLKLKNFRDKWVGSTESNLEKILELVDALGYVLLILDEADRSLAAGDSDGGVSSRVIARLKEFMSDTSHRGRVVMLMMTNRPDKLDVDLKRPGRFDMKIPFFFPEAPEERRLILEALLRKNKMSLEDGVSLRFATEATEGYSGAELEAVLLAAASRAADEDREALSQEDVDAAARDVIPSRDSRMLELMEMLAVFECSARRMLPERYRELSTEDVQARLDALKAQLGLRSPWGLTAQG